jgi:hypothetical protein
VCACTIDANGRPCHFGDSHHILLAMTKYTKTLVALWLGAAVGVALAEPPRDQDDLRAKLNISDASAGGDGSTPLMSADTLRRLEGLRIESKAEYGEPTYNGQPLRHWVEVLGGLEGLIDQDESVVRIENIRGGAEAQDALKHIGTNAIPFLFRWCGGWDLEPPSVTGISAEKTPALLPPTSQQKLVQVGLFMWKGASRSLDVLGPEAAPILLPTLTNKAYPLGSRVMALGTVVKAMGTNGQALLPLVIQCADGDEDALARAAVHALGTVGVGRPEALAVLEKSLQDPQRAGWRNVTLEAVAGLGNIGIPTLARGFSSNSSGTRHLAKHLLVYRVPQGLTNPVVLAAAAENLRSADEDRRLLAAELLRAADQQARGLKPDDSMPLRERYKLVDSATNILRRLAPELLDRTP